MKKIIPFKKDLPFKTKISEITSISLEHTLKIEDDYIITGEFLITGDYKITDGNIDRKPFSYKLPFDIALNSTYDLDNIKVDIEDFYYEVINSEILRVNIDVYVEGEEKEELLLESSVIPSEKIIEDLERNEEEQETNITINNVNINNNQEQQPISDNFDIFNSLQDSETYATYRVYFVKEDDTLDKILTKYNITKEQLSNYNDLENIKPKDKLIIPLSDE